MTDPFRGQYSVDIFMRDYWQKRPLILQKAFPESSFNISRNDIFYMASMAGFDSRLIEEDVHHQSWELFTGPIDREEFENLEEFSHWTVLVQDTERELDQMRRLLERFRFIPNWRLDDVQLSYAAPGGSAGPHVDSYDVFLIQVSGERRWHIESNPVAADRAMREDVPLKLLKELHPDQEFVARPGDLLYLPPRVPHWGVAVGECITASIGFKAPGVSLLQTAFLEISEQVRSAPRTFSDPAELCTDDPGHVSDAPLDWFQDEVRRLAEDRDLLERILCTSMTHPVRENWPGATIDPIPSAEEIPDDLRQGSTYERFAPSCMVYREFDDRIRLYAFGTEYEQKPEMKSFVQLLTGTEVLNFDTFKPYLERQEVLELLHFLLECSALIRKNGSS